VKTLVKKTFSQNCSSEFCILKSSLPLKGLVAAAAVG